MEISENSSFSDYMWMGKREFLHFALCRSSVGYLVVLHVFDSLPDEIVSVFIIPGFMCTRSTVDGDSGIHLSHNSGIAA